MSRAWQDDPRNTGELFGTNFHNVWRSFRFTTKGRQAGHSAEWSKFAQFKADMYESYIPGTRLSRIDKTKPFSKENCIWQPQSEIISKKTLMLEYNGVTQPLMQWAKDFGLHYPAVRQRYQLGRGYCAADILFGIRKSKRSVPVDYTDLPCDQSRRDKASKMLSAYRCRDKKKGHTWLSEDYPDNQWFTDNIIKSACTYCGSSKNVGADRIDNALPHTKRNIVPSCYRCNVVRQDLFTVDEMKLIGAFIRDRIDSARSGG